MLSKLRQAIQTHLKLMLIRVNLWLSLGNKDTGYRIQETEYRIQNTEFRIQKGRHFTIVSPCSVMFIEG